MVRKEALFERADALKRKIQSMRPLSIEELHELDEYFKIGSTYTSNALEGNSLTLTETKLLLEDGITVGGKPLKDCYEAVGHGRAYDYMLQIARSVDVEVTEEIIKKIHYLFYAGIDPEYAGRYRDTQVIITGTEYLPPPAKKVPEEMKRWIVQMRMLKSTVHPIEYAALCHKGLVDIHPFKDGNGRCARLLTNLILVNEGYGVISIPPILRHAYISALVTSQREKAPSNEPFIELIAECVIETQRDYCRMFDR